jgi:hypothetical protein
MDEDQQDIDSAAEHQQELEESRRREPSGWGWWSAYQDRVAAERRAEMERLKTAVDRLFK